VRQAEHEALALPGQQVGRSIGAQCFVAARPGAKVEVRQRAGDGYACAAEGGVYGWRLCPWCREAKAGGWREGCTASCLTLSRQPMHLSG
jgi:hypothetical protein